MERSGTSQRRLAAILMADAVGYSRMMGQDEAATVAAIKASREIFRDHVDNRSGRIVNSPGDSILAEFGSVVDALAAAVEIQREVAERNSDTPVERAMQFRIGINLGDVVSEDDAVYGDGVNIAARLEALADAGGICISRGAYDQAKGKLPLEYEYLGEHEVKNIADPVRVYRVLSVPGAAAHRVARARASAFRAGKWTGLSIGAVGLAAIIAVGFYYWGPSGYSIRPAFDPEGPLREETSIAVLPFTNLSDDPDQDYFSDGLTDEIITKLSYLRQLAVIARNTVFQFKGQNVDVRELGERLNVDYVLEGSVRRTEDRLRVTAQLIDATSGNHVWAEQWDRSLADDLEIQEEIAARISDELNIELSEGSYYNTLMRSSDPKATDYHRMGWKHGHEGRDREARHWFDKAVKQDPSFAMTMLSIGWSHALEVSNGKSPDPARSIRLAQEWADKAKAIEPDHPEWYHLQGFIDLLSGDLDAAMQKLSRAVELSPNCARCMITLGAAHNVGGRETAEKAISLLQRSIRLDPLPHFGTWSTLSWAYMETGRFEACIDPSLKSVELFPDWEATRISLIICYQASGQEERAREQVQELLRINPEFRVEQGLWLSALQDPELVAELNEYLYQAGLP